MDTDFRKLKDTRNLVGGIDVTGSTRKEMNPFFQQAQQLVCASPLLVTLEPVLHSPDLFPGE